MVVVILDCGVLILEIVNQEVNKLYFFLLLVELFDSGVESSLSFFFKGLVDYLKKLLCFLGLLLLIQYFNLVR